MRIQANLNILIGPINKVNKGRISGKISNEKMHSGQLYETYKAQNLIKIIYQYPDLALP